MKHIKTTLAKFLTQCLDYLSLFYSPTISIFLYIFNLFSRVRRKNLISFIIQMFPKSQKYLWWKLNEQWKPKTLQCERYSNTKTQDSNMNHDYLREKRKRWRHKLLFLYFTALWKRENIRKKKLFAISFAAAPKPSEVKSFSMLIFFIYHFYFGHFHSHGRKYGNFSFIFACCHNFYLFSYSSHASLSINTHPHTKQTSKLTTYNF